MIQTNIKRAIKKAQSSKCREKVSAIALNHQNEIIGFARNTPRFVKKGGSIHAEMALMARYGKNIKTLLICRTNKSGDMLPIHPCPICKNKAEELGIRITTLIKSNK